MSSVSPYRARNSALSLAAAVCGLWMIAPSLAQASPPRAEQGSSDDEQEQRLPQSQPSTTVAAHAGRVASSPVGEVGIRQTRDQATDIVPMARIANRIQNRVQSRIHNRLDRNYDPSMNTTSAFEGAEEKTKKFSRSGNN